WAALEKERLRLAVHPRNSGVDQEALRAIAEDKSTGLSSTKEEVVSGEPRVVKVAAMRSGSDHDPDQQ
ncbi:hypothetical protein HDU93_001999, partial [Gonapodya sp. JEL0774]